MTTTEQVITPGILNKKDYFMFMELRTQENEIITYLMKELKAFIAGGFAVHCYRPENPFGDIDFYFPNVEAYEKAVEYVKKTVGYDPSENLPYIGTSVRATTFRINSHIFQLIKTTYGSVQEVLDSFDFTNSKVAMTYEPGENYCLSWHLDNEVTALLDTKKVKYRRQVNLMLDTEVLKRDHAKSNLDRLEKYLQRFPNGFYDVESREQLLQQYAWNLKYKYTASPLYLTSLSKILSNATQDELIMFYPLGGAWKQAFETSGVSIAKEQPF
jgi:hypothetical protein